MLLMADKTLNDSKKKREEKTIERNMFSISESRIF